MSVVMVVLLACAMPASANLVADPGFDLGWGGTWWYGYGDMGVEMISWGGNNPDWWGPCATFWADNGGYNSGGIYDWNIPGTPGDTYQISVDLRFQDVFDATVDVGLMYLDGQTWDGGTVLGEEWLTLTAADVSPHDPDGEVTEEDWETFTFTGTAAPAGTVWVQPWVRYRDVGPTSNNWFFADNVVLIPEPASLCLLALGGLTALRRRR